MLRFMVLNYCFVWLRRTSPWNWITQGAFCGYCMSIPSRASLASFCRFYLPILVVITHPPVTTILSLLQVNLVFILEKVSSTLMIKSFIAWFYFQCEIGILGNTSKPSLKLNHKWYCQVKLFCKFISTRSMSLRLRGNYICCS